nr:ATP-binding protein [Limosilactobacillus caccae]
MTQSNFNTRRHYHQLTSEQRGQIEALHDLGLTNTAIARKLHCHRSTIGRELKRGSVLQRNSDYFLYHHYFGETAQIKHDQCRLRCHRCHELIERLKLAYQENRLEPMLKNYLRYKLLIIDEIGYLPIDDLGSNLFFQLISRRYEKKSIIVTTNIPLSKWGQTFSNPTIANAILDRLVHHSEIFKISGKSYRMKDYTEQHTKQNLNR